MTKKRFRKNRSALRISHIVYGRRAKGTKVTYLVDPKGEGQERAVPETVALRRWRRKLGGSYSGDRLSSTLWRALPVVLGKEVRRWPSKTEPAIKTKLTAKRKVLQRRRLSAPEAGIVWALLQSCPTQLLIKLVARHAALGKERRSGVPDLFLFAWNRKGRPCKVRFVEVKKPKERVSQDQLDEIALLNRHGLAARVLRLIERELPRRRAKSRGRKRHSE